MRVRIPARSMYVAPLAAIAAFGPLHARPPQAGHGFHVPLPDQVLYVQCRIDRNPDAAPIEKILHVGSSSAPADLNETLALPEASAPLLLKRYLPRAARRQSVVAVGAAEGRPAIDLAIVGPSQSARRWLVAGDPERNRLTSLVGTWRYMEVERQDERDALYQQFRDELTRPPRLIITRADGGEAVELLMEPGQTQRAANLDCAVTLRRFLPNFGIDDKTGDPVNRSDERLNPAALVVIEHEGTQEERWVFAKFPGFQSHGSDSLPFRVQLDCPLQRQNPAPDFAIVTIGRTRHEAWTRHGASVSSRAMQLAEPLEVPDTRYTFSLMHFLASGRLEETYEASEEATATTVLHIEVPTQPGTYTPVWLELGESRNVSTEAGRITIIFASRPAGSDGGASWDR